MKIEDIKESSAEQVQDELQSIARFVIEEHLKEMPVPQGLHDSLEAIRQAHESIIRYEAEIQGLKEKIKQEKETMNEVSRCVIQKISSSPEIADIVVAYLYWGFPGVQRDAIDQRGMALRQDIMPISFPVEDTCSECQTEYIITHKFKTRSDAQMQIGIIKRDIKRGRKFICTECREKLHAQRAAERDEENRAKQERLAKLKTMPYQDYLQTPEWADTRRRALGRARFKCELCHSGSRLQVHHKTYERRGEEDNKDLIVLCRDCHAKFHDKLEECS